MQSSSQQGLTLIGVLVATIILSIIGVSASQLLTRSERVAEVASSEFVASNIAREGLELVRAMRDNNWFQGDDETEWIGEELCAEFTYDTAAARAGDGPGSVDDAALFIDKQTHEWGHRTGNGDDSGYSRVLEINCDERNSEIPYVTVTSTIRWEVRGQERDVVLKERLYNWMPV
ncbi:MAG: prepilin-type N-terminal cleavage/methylation domain-containing protein [Candidatus Andersenbacteria bacterium]|nr:prepilin-type N-terminal cleavage/methylation domain-containing protein [Candidatus Andersenbacteria bacterium]